MDRSLALIRLTAVINVAAIALVGPLGCASNGRSGELELTRNRLRSIGDARIRKHSRNYAEYVKAAHEFSVVADSAVESDTPSSPWFERVATLSDLGDESLHDTQHICHLAQSNTRSR